MKYYDKNINTIIKDTNFNKNEIEKRILELRKVARIDELFVSRILKQLL